MSQFNGSKIPRNGLICLLDASNPKSAGHSKQSSNILSDPHFWTSGDGSTPGYGPNGSTTEQSRALRTDPWGGTSMTWRSVPDATSGADGGWNSSTYSIDRSFTYRWSTFVKRYTASTGGTFYFGLNPAPIRNDNDAVQSNPYFTYPAISSLVQDRWYMVVAHCFYEGYTGGRHPDSGWYELANGKWSKISDKSYGNVGTEDVRWDPSTTGALHRSYHFYTTNTACGIEWAFPRLDKCDGTEPSVYQILNQGEGKWNDLSGNGNHGIIASHSNVTWSPDFGGVFNFDATTNSSKVDINVGNYSSVDSTVIMAGRYDGTGSNLQGRTLSSLSNNWLLGHHSGSNRVHYAEGWITGTGESTGNATDWGIHVATRDSSLDHSDYWFNGTKVDDNSTAGAAGPNGLSVGRYGQGNSQYSNCQVGFVAMWNRILTDAEIKDVTDMLKGRYGI